MRTSNTLRSSFDISEDVIEDSEAELRCILAQQ